MELFQKDHEPLNSIYFRGLACIKGYQEKHLSWKTRNKNSLIINSFRLLLERQRKFSAPSDEHADQGHFCTKIEKLKIAGTEPYKVVLNGDAGSKECSRESNRNLSKAFVPNHLISIKDVIRDLDEGFLISEFLKVQHRRNSCNKEVIVANILENWLRRNAEVKVTIFDYFLQARLLRKRSAAKREVETKINKRIEKPMRTSEKKIEASTDRTPKIEASTDCIPKIEASTERIPKIEASTERIPSMKISDNSINRIFNSEKGALRLESRAIGSNKKRTDPSKENVKIPVISKLRSLLEKKCNSNRKEEVNPLISPRNLQPALNKSNASLKPRLFECDLESFDRKNSNRSSRHRKINIEQKSRVPKLFKIRLRDKTKDQVRECLSTSNERYLDLKDDASEIRSSRGLISDRKDRSYNNYFEGYKKEEYHKDSTPWISPFMLKNDSLLNIRHSPVKHKKNINKDDIFARSVNVDQFTKEQHNILQKSVISLDQRALRLFENCTSDENFSLVNNYRKFTPFM